MSVSCRSCGAENGERARFCVSCGTSLAAACSACGEPARPAQRFCGNCGASLGSEVQPTVGRRRSPSGASARCCTPAASAVRPQRNRQRPAHRPALRRDHGHHLHGQHARLPRRGQVLREARQREGDDPDRPLPATDRAHSASAKVGVDRHPVRHCQPPDDRSRAERPEQCRRRHHRQRCSTGSRGPGPLRPRDRGPQIPTNIGAGANQDVVLAGRLTDSHLWEQAPRIEAFQATYAPSLQVFIRLYNYIAVAHRYSQLLVQITGTGLVTPLF